MANNDEPKKGLFDEVSPQDKLKELQKDFIPASDITNEKIGSEVKIAEKGTVLDDKSVKKKESFKKIKKGADEPTSYVPTQTEVYDQQEKVEQIESYFQGQEWKSDNDFLNNVGTKLDKMFETYYPEGSDKMLEKGEKSLLDNTPGSTLWSIQKNLFNSIDGLNLQLEQIKQDTYKAISPYVNSIIEKEDGTPIIDWKKDADIKTVNKLLDEFNEKSRPLREQFAEKIKKAQEISKNTKDETITTLDIKRLERIAKEENPFAANVAGSILQRFNFNLNKIRDEITWQYSGEEKTRDARRAFWDDMIELTRSNESKNLKTLSEVLVDSPYTIIKSAITDLVDSVAGWASLAGEIVGIDNESLEKGFLVRKLMKEAFDLKEDAPYKDEKGITTLDKRQAILNDFNPEDYNLLKELKQFNDLQLYENDLAKFFDEAADQTGKMGAFILTMQLTGGLGMTAKMEMASGKLASSMKLGKYMKSVLSGDALKVPVIETYMRNALSGIAMTYPKYLEEWRKDFDKIEDKQWYDYVGLLSMPLVQSAMEGMSESVGAHFLGGVLGKGTAKLLSYGRNPLLKKVNNAFFNTFLSQNIGEVLEERINDIVSLGQFAATGQFVDESGNKVEGTLGDFMKDQLKKSAYEFLMFSASSNFYSAVLTGQTVKAGFNLYSEKVYNDFFKYLEKKYNLSNIPENIKKEFFDKLKGDAKTLNGVKNNFNAFYDKSIVPIIQSHFRSEKEAQDKKEIFNSMVNSQLNSLFGVNNPNYTKEANQQVLENMGVTNDYLRTLGLSNEIDGKTVNYNVENITTNEGGQKLYQRVVDQEKRMLTGTKKATPEQIEAIKQRDQYLEERQFLSDEIDPANAMENSIKAGISVKTAFEFYTGKKFKVLDFRTRDLMPALKITNKEQAKRLINEQIKGVKLEDLEANSITAEDLFQSLPNDAPLDADLKELVQNKAKNAKIFFYTAHEGAAAFYLPNSKYIGINANTIYRKSQRKSLQRNLYHELSHAILHTAIENDPEIKQQVKSLAEQFIAEYEHTFDSQEKYALVERFQNSPQDDLAQEFAAYIFQDTKLHDRLRKLGQPPKVGFWKSLYDFLAKVFDFLPERENSFTLFKELVTDAAETVSSIDNSRNYFIEGMETTPFPNVLYSEDTFDLDDIRDPTRRTVERYERERIEKATSPAAPEWKEVKIPIMNALSGDSDRKKLEDKYEIFVDAELDLQNAFNQIKAEGFNLFQTMEEGYNFVQEFKGMGHLEGFDKFVDKIQQVLNPEEYDRFAIFADGMNKKFLAETASTSTWLHNLYAELINREKFEYAIVEQVKEDKKRGTNPFKEGVSVSIMKAPFKDAHGHNKQLYGKRDMLHEHMKMLEDKGIRIKVHPISYFSIDSGTPTEVKVTSMSKYRHAYNSKTSKATPTESLAIKLFQKGYVLLEAQSESSLLIDLNEIEIRDANGKWKKFPFTPMEVTRIDGYSSFDWNYYEKVVESLKDPNSFLGYMWSKIDLGSFTLQDLYPETQAGQAEINQKKQMTIKEFIESYSDLVGSYGSSLRFSETSPYADPMTQTKIVNGKEEKTTFPTHETFFRIISAITTKFVWGDMYYENLLSKVGMQNPMTFLKRVGAINGYSSKALLTDKIVKMLSDNKKETHGIWLENGQVKVRSVIIDPSTIPNQMKTAEFGDGASFVTHFVHKVDYALNRILQKKQGNVGKYKVFNSLGILHKKASHVMPKHTSIAIQNISTETTKYIDQNSFQSKIAEFARINQLGEVNFKSAIKIGADEYIADDKMVSWNEVVNLERIDKSKTFERDIMENAWSMGGGTELRKQKVGGLMPAIIRTFIGGWINTDLLANWQRQRVQQYADNIGNMVSDPRNLRELLIEFAEKNSYNSTNKQFIEEFVNDAKYPDSIAFIHFLKEYFFKGVLSSKLKELTSFFTEGMYPALTPDLGDMTSYKDILLHTKQITNEEANIYFDEQGFLKPGYIILSRDSKRIIKAKKGTKIIAATIPPAGLQDIKPLQVIGFVEGKNAIIMNNWQAQEVSGRDYDIDKIAIFNVENNEFLNHLWNKSTDYEKVYLEASEKFEELVSDEEHQQYKDTINKDITKSGAVMLSLYGRTEFGKHKIDFRNPKMFSALMSSVNTAYIDTVYDSAVLVSFLSELRNLSLYKHKETGEIITTYKFANLKPRARELYETALSLPIDTRISSTDTEAKDKNGKINPIALYAKLTHNALDWQKNPEILLYDFTPEKTVSLIYNIPEEYAKAIIDEWKPIVRVLLSPSRDKQDVQSSVTETLTNIEKASKLADELESMILNTNAFAEVYSPAPTENLTNEQIAEITRDIRRKRIPFLVKNAKALSAIPNIPIHKYPKSYSNNVLATKEKQALEKTFDKYFRKHRNSETPAMFYVARCLQIISVCSYPDSNFTNAQKNLRLLWAYSTYSQGSAFKNLIVSALKEKAFTINNENITFVEQGTNNFSINYDEISDKFFPSTSGTGTVIQFTANKDKKDFGVTRLHYKDSQLITTQKYESFNEYYNEYKEQFDNLLDLNGASNIVKGKLTGDPLAGEEFVPEDIPLLKEQFFSDILFGNPDSFLSFKTGEPGREFSDKIYKEQFEKTFYNENFNTKFSENQKAWLFTAILGIMDVPAKYENIQGHWYQLESIRLGIQFGSLGAEILPQEATEMEIPSAFEEAISSRNSEWEYMTEEEQDKLLTAKYVETLRNEGKRVERRIDGKYYVITPRQYSSFANPILFLNQYRDDKINGLTIRMIVDNAITTLAGVSSASVGLGTPNITKSLPFSDEYVPTEERKEELLREITEVLEQERPGEVDAFLEDMLNFITSEELRRGYEINAKEEIKNILTSAQRKNKLAEHVTSRFYGRNIPINRMMKYYSTKNILMLPTDKLEYSVGGKAKYIDKNTILTLLDTFTLLHKPEYVGGAQIAWAFNTQIHLGYENLADSQIQYYNELLTIIQDTIGEGKGLQATTDILQSPALQALIYDMANKRDAQDTLGDLFTTGQSGQFRYKNGIYNIVSKTPEKKFDKKELVKLATAIESNLKKPDELTDYNKDLTIRIIASAIASRYIATDVMESLYSVYSKDIAFAKKLVGKLPFDNAAKFEAIALISKIENGIQMAKNKIEDKNGHVMPVSYFNDKVKEESFLRLEKNRIRKENSSFSEKTIETMAKESMAENKKAIREQKRIMRAMYPKENNIAFGDLGESYWVEDNFGFDKTVPVLEQYINTTVRGMRSSMLSLYQMINQRFVEQDNSFMQHEIAFCNGLITNGTFSEKEVPFDKIKKGMSLKVTRWVTKEEGQEREFDKFYKTHQTADWNVTSDELKEVVSQIEQEAEESDELFGRGVYIKSKDFLERFKDNPPVYKMLSAMKRGFFLAPIIKKLPDGLSAEETLFELVTRFSVERVKQYASESSKIFKKEGKEVQEEYGFEEGDYLESQMMLVKGIDPETGNLITVDGSNNGYVLSKYKVMKASEIKGFETMGKIKRFIAVTLGIKIANYPLQLLGELIDAFASLAISMHNYILLGLNNLTYATRNTMGAKAMLTSYSSGYAKNTFGITNFFSIGAKQKEFEKKSSNLQEVVERGIIPETQEATEEIYKMLRKESAFLLGGVEKIMGKFGGVLSIMDNNPRHTNDILIKLDNFWGTQVPDKLNDLHTIFDMPKENFVQELKTAGRDKSAVARRFSAALEFSRKTYQDYGMYNLLLSLFGKAQSAIGSPLVSERENRYLTIAVLLHEIVEKMNIDSPMTDAQKEIYSKLIFEKLQLGNQNVNFQYLPGLFLSHFDSTRLGRVFKQYSHYQNNVNQSFWSRAANLQKRARDLGFNWRGEIKYKTYLDGSPINMWEESEGMRLARMTFLTGGLWLLRRLVRTAGKTAYAYSAGNLMFSALTQVIFGNTAQGFSVPPINMLMDISRFLLLKMIQDEQDDEKIKILYRGSPLGEETERDLNFWQSIAAYDANQLNQAEYSDSPFSTDAYAFGRQIILGQTEWEYTEQQRAILKRIYGKRYNKVVTDAVLFRNYYRDMAFTLSRNFATAGVGQQQLLSLATEMLLAYAMPIGYDYQDAFRTTGSNIARTIVPGLNLIGDWGRDVTFDSKALNSLLSRSEIYEKKKLAQQLKDNANYLKNVSPKNVGSEEWRERVKKQSEESPKILIEAGLQQVEFYNKKHRTSTSEDKSSSDSTKFKRNEKLLEMQNNLNQLKQTNPQQEE